jgi:hypothetical protein
MLRREFVAGIGVLSVFGSRMTRAAVKDPLPQEGVEFIYRVLFGGNEIGTQKVSIRQHDTAGHVVVEHQIKLEVRILFAVAYALEHRSTEVWEGFTLKSVHSETIENTEQTVVEGEATEAGFRIRNAHQSERVVQEGVVTSDSFWLAAAMKSPKVINTRTGDTASPDLKDLGNGRWHLKANFDHGPIEATMRFDGDFLVEANVDSDGHTVRMERIDT